MKIALCLSGQPRYIKECYQYIEKYILEPFNPDIYAHMWWDDSYIGKIFKFHALDQYEENMKDVFNSYFPNANVCFEKQVDFNINNFDLDNGEMSLELGANKHMWSKEVIFKQYSMWYSVLKSYELINKDYDIYIRARTDLIYNQHLELDNSILRIDDYENKSQLCDWFATGNKNDFAKYCNTFNLIDEISNNKVIKSTTLLRESLNKQFCNFSISNFRVDIFRGYIKPFHMDNYTNESFTKPYWF